MYNVGIYIYICTKWTTHMYGCIGQGQNRLPINADCDIFNIVPILAAA